MEFLIVNEVTDMPSSSKRFVINASWLIKLRWVAVFGQVATIAMVIGLLKIPIETAWALGVVIGLTAFSNVVLTVLFVRGSRAGNHVQLSWDFVLGLVMVMDMLSLTALLFATGGPTNPFCLFFFVNLSLCAVVLKPSWAWSLNGLSILCFGLLMVEYHQIDALNLGYELAPLSERHNPSLHQLGMLTAFGTCSSVIVYFMTRLTAELRKQQREIQKAQASQARSEKIEALGTLAAGTAHELATPLSTIAIVARDVEKAFDEHPPDFPGAEDVVEDVHLIRSQLDRCRGILDRMASGAGQAIGEGFQSVSLPDLVDEILDGIPENNRIEVALPATAREAVVHVPRVQLSLAIRGLVQNAIDASAAPVQITIEPEVENWRWVIRDFGTGMSVEVLDRVSEPFFTTKAPGKGMGLGVFLAQNVINRLDGRLEFSSGTNQGTRVTIWLPRIEARDGTLNQHE